jgi:hypothetical protein
MLILGNFLIYAIIYRMLLQQATACSWRKSFCMANYSVCPEVMKIIDFLLF